MNLNELIYEINKTKKYSSLYQPFLKRICSEEFVKYKKDKDKLKAVKNRLHIIYGAFFINIKDYNQNINAITDKKETNEIEILKLHASTNERLPSIDEFYKFIFDNLNNNIKTEEINSILDIGCGFNPFSLPFIYSHHNRHSHSRLPNLKYYYALDIDLKLAGILNEYFKNTGLPPLAGCIDVMTENPKQRADIAFLFKLIPTIENCKKGRGYELISQIDAKYITVTFPVKTLCGKDKGMAGNYAVSFEENIDCGKFQILAKNIIGTELIYILIKN